MKKFIVTTTINNPTLATVAFSQMQDWTLIIVGDLKTPHKEYKELNCIYLDPDQQEKNIEIFPILLDGDRFKGETSDLLKPTI